MDRLESMHMFVRVAESGSFSAVARQLGVVRSVVTRQVAALEAHLGTRLIARSTRSLSLTSAGSDYLERCREILDLVEAAETGFAEDRRAPRGLVRVSVPLSFGLRHLMPLMLDFGRTYPEVSIDLDFTDRRITLIEEGVDLAVRVTTALDAQDVARRIGSSHLTVVASPGYLARFNEPAHPMDLVHHDCLIYPPSQAGGWRFHVDGQMRNFPVRAVMRANNGDALLDAAIRGFGITVQPRFITASAIEAGHVRELLTAFPMPELGIFAVLPGNRLVPHRVRVLVDYLAARIGDRPYWEKQEQGDLV